MTIQDKKTDSDAMKKDLKNATDEKSVWTVLQRAFSNLVTLEIETVVTSSSGDKALLTRIDLLQSDRTNEIAESFLKDADLKGILDFHEKQVEFAQQDIAQRVEFLRSIGEAILEAVKKKGPASS